MTIEEAPRKLLSELRSLTYWENQSHDEGGVMGGFESLSPIDEANSRKLIENVLIPRRLAALGHRSFAAAADLGAGIGRVSERVLGQYCDQIDLSEPIAGNRVEARKRLADPVKFRIFGDTLQSWKPRVNQYDLIWIQFAIIYASDAECVALLSKAAHALAPHGFVVIKENMKREVHVVLTKDAIASTTHASDFTEEDCSTIRSEVHLISLAAEAGLRLEYRHKQNDWPQDLYQVSSLVFGR